MSHYSRLAGRVGDGMNAPAGPRLRELVAIAREAHAAAGRDPDAFVVTASAGPSPAARDALTELGVDRQIVYVASPYVDGVARAAAALAR